MKFGASLVQRKEYIKNANETGVIDRVTFRGSELQLPELSIPIDIVKYRLTNMRTEQQQFDYINKHELKEDFFTQDVESEEAQKIQHKLLKSLLGSGAKNLKTYFRG